ncbi:MAG: response regulator [Candidatus Hydrogenedentes bacterium]|nr:response regulator [Candidatus Hydrogenedentota bacterium]
MGIYILALSILLQFSAAATAILLAYRTRTIPWYVLSLAIFLMGVRRSLTLYRVLEFDRIVYVSTEAVVLTISVLMLLGIIGIFRSSNRSSEDPDIFTWREETRTLHRLTSTGLLLGAATILASTIVGYSSFVAGREAAYQKTYDSNLALARALASEADRHAPDTSTAEILTNIGEIASDIDISNKGGYVCAIDRDGILTLHTKHPEYIGKNVGHMPIHSDSFDTMAGLVSSEEDWVGHFISRSGEAQIVAASYSSGLDMSLMLHVPQASIDAAYRAQALPWSIGLVVLIVFLIPLSLGFLRMAFVTTLHNFSKATQALRESEARYRLLADHVSDVIFAIDSDQKFTYISPSLERLTGQSTDRVERIPIQSTVTPESFERIQKFIQDDTQAEKEGADPDRTATLKLDLVCLDGKIIPVETKVAYTRDSTGKRTGVVGIARDISERVEAEKQRQELEEQLRHSQKMDAVGTLAGGIAHDFNNILQAILGFSEMAREIGLADDEREECLDEISAGAIRGADLVKRILAFSSTTEVEHAPLDLQKSMLEAIRLLRGSLPSTIKIRTEISPTVSPVYGDPIQFQQIVMNLCTNAYDAMGGAGGILQISLKDTVISARRASASSDLGEGNYVTLTVRDTGCGISPENMQRIFDPFFTTKEIGKGTGLGLSVIHGIVKNMDGTIEVKSVEGEGTIVEVFWPALKAIDPPSNVEKGTAMRNGRADGKERILFVDDETSIVKLIQLSFEREGYEIEAYTNPSEAFDAFRERQDKYDIVITDLTMPEMSGMELADEIHLLNNKVPIVLCTGMGEYDNDPTELERIGIVECLSKPLTVDKLYEAIERHCGKSISRNRAMNGNS